MGDLVIIGAGDGGKTVYNLAELNEDENDDSWGILGFIDDNKKLKNKYIFSGCEDSRVLGTTDDLKKFKGNYFIIAIGVNLKVKEALYLKAIKAGLKPLTLIHESAIIHESAYIGDGSVILANCAVGPKAQIHNNVFLFTGTIIEHDSVISNNVYASPGVCLAGNVHVGENTFLGINSCAIQGIKIGSNVIVGAGAVVVKHVENDMIIVGNPAKVLRKNV